MVRAWTNAFRLLVAPLVVSQLYLALAGARLSGREAGRLGLAVPAVFTGLLVFVAAVAVSAALTLLDLPLLAGISLRSVAASPLPVAVAAGGGASWVDVFIPPNLMAAAITDNLLPLMLFVMAFGLAIGARMPKRRPRSRGWRAVYRTPASRSSAGCCGSPRS
jgi:Na+/H+-dicarboxylate symporter